MRTKKKAAKKKKTVAKRKKAERKTRKKTIRKKQPERKRIVRKRETRDKPPESESMELKNHMNESEVDTSQFVEEEKQKIPEYIRHIPTEEELLEKVKIYNRKMEDMKNEIKKGIIGQDKVIDSVLKCLVAGGHVLLESVPGLAKTFLSMLLSRTIEGSTFNRIQFTPDLLPTDITGVTVYDKIKGFYVMKGPIFANVVLADELNRTPPKVQSAMLQAMQEKQVTIGRKTFDLPKPFFVIATQNPLEQRGVYPLSVAQVDRFLFKVFVDYPDEEHEFIVMDQNSNMKNMEEYGIRAVITPYEILEMQDMVKYIHLSQELKEYIVNIVDATRYPENYGIGEIGKYIQYGGSPRATINIGLASKATALLNGRVFVTPEDVRSVAKEVLRHRIILNYEGKAKEIQTDDIIDEILKKVPVL